MTMKEVYQPFVSHPNQLIGKIHKPSDYKKRYNQEGKKYMLVGIDEIREAAINLTPSAFKLYLYFVENENDWQFFLSPKDFQKAYGVAESTFRNAKKELIEKKYIIEGDKNHFDFYSTPQNNIDKETLVKEFNKVGSFLVNEGVDITIYQKKLLEIKSILNENEKLKEQLKLLKEMKEELNKIYEGKTLFDLS